ncbi:hypothetical protein SH2C18_48450 [Clostridium sediminicola]|uniref:hypothetical protein n=1 Tax=Clostridium sediminicola TaxID=3114879 RepID=UPI0031F1DC87
MELIISKSKGQRTREMLIEGSNAIFFLIFTIILIIGMSIVSSSFKIGILLIYTGGIYFVVLFNRIIKVVLLKEEIRVVLKLINYGLEIITYDGAVIIPYKYLIKVQEKRDSTKVVVSKKCRLKSLYLPKKYIVEGNITEFIQNLQEKILSSKTNRVISNDVKIIEDKNYILSIKSSVIKDLLRQMSIDYRNFKTIILIFVNLFFGLILINSENGKTGGYILLSLAILVILKPVINLLESIYKGQATTHLFYKDNKLEIINNNTYCLDVDILRISKDNKNQTIIRSLKNSKFIFGMYDSEVINGSTERLFEIIEYEKIILNKSVLGTIAIISSGISVVAILLVLIIGQYAVFICLGSWIISVICSLMNLFKKGIYKKFALISCFINLIIGMFFIYILTQI